MKMFCRCNLMFEAVVRIRKMKINTKTLLVSNPKNTLIKQFFVKLM